MFAIVICLVLLMCTLTIRSSVLCVLMVGGEVMYFGCVCFRGELGFLNCDDICMCVMNKQVPFMLTCSMMRFLSHLLLGLCPSSVSVVVAVTVMRVLLVVLHVCMLKECEGDGNASVGDG